MEKVSIIIPTFNRKNMLVRCIDSILSNTYDNFEIIISDDNSKDGTNNIIKKYSNNKKIKYLKNDKEMLLSYTINRAIKESSGVFIFILDDDNVIDKNCIANLVKSFKIYKNAGVIGPLALYYSNKNIIMHAGAERSKFMRRAIYPYQNEKWANQINEGKRVHDFLNAFMFRKSIIKKTGMWDLLVPFMGEDGDFQARVRKLNYDIIINPSAITYHDIKYNPHERYFIRLNNMRLYHVMHSKILYEYRYDNLAGKITFTVSLFVYVLYYIFVIYSYNKTKMRGELVKNLFCGVIKGLKDTIMKKSQIEWL
ncbi:MAG: glycosyltransferase family 2 protein [Candidatus Marsarchaeota archaeon]|nr:glycosyltransferase family 2 protein [Candidatus Marsarchaeota archaeon]